MLFPQAAEGVPSFSKRDRKLSNDYSRWFEVIPANTPELREEAYRLRYQVYCRERQFETPDEHPRQLETDVFDQRSIHSLIIDKASGTATGTVRLILPDPDSPESCFPIQHLCGEYLPIKHFTSSAAEISRFSISKKMKNRVHEDCPKDMKCSVALGLMRAIVQMSTDRGITDWFAVMEPSLLRLLCRFGIYFTPIGPLVEYHGTRQPCHANSDTLLGRVRHEHFDLWEFLTEPYNVIADDKAFAANF
jgi:N-acyl amino acid synthase of PEP-CTERM/exosortase system